MSIVNLLPEDYADRRASRRTNGIALMMFTVVMAGILAAVFVNQKGVNTTQDVLDHVTGEYTNAAKLIDTLKELDKRKQTMQQKTKTTSALVERQPRSFLLATITNAMPEAACMTSLKMAPVKKTDMVMPPPPANGKPQRNVKPVKVERIVTEVVITGLAATDLDVTKLMSSLKECPLVETVDLDYSGDRPTDLKHPDTNKTLTNRVYREYRIKMILNPDKDVLDILAEQKGAAIVAAY